MTAAEAPLGLTEGKHAVTMTVTGKNDAATDYLAGFDYLELDATLAPVPTPTAVATAQVGATVPATLALAVDSATAPGKLVNGNHSLAEPLQVGGAPLPATVKRWDGPTSAEPVELAFTQHIGARDPLRTGTFSKTLTLTLSTTNP